MKERNIKIFLCCLYIILGLFLSILCFSVNLILLGIGVFFSFFGAILVLLSL